MRNLMIKILVIASISILTTAQVSYPTFEEYVKQFGKTYETQEQYAMRQTIYNDNIKFFQTITTFTPGVNEMTDWTPEEIKSRKNLKQLDDSVKTIRVPPTNGRLGAALSYDWRDQGAVTSIKNQAGCGACTTFASAAVAESFLIISKRFTNTTINLSQEYLLSCVSDVSCNGGYLESTMQASRNLPSEAQYPYVAKPLSVSICSANTLKVSLTNNDYYNLTDAQIINLLQSGPVAISVSSDMWEYYSLGIFSCRSGVQVDHAVVIVGYTPDYWIVKNQWGTNWGLNGYIHITRNRTNNCAIGHSIHTLQGTVTSTSNDSKFIFTGSSTDADNTVNYTNGSSSSNLYNSENKIILQSFGFILFFVFMAIQ